MPRSRPPSCSTTSRAPSTPTRRSTSRCGTTSTPGSPASSQATAGRRWRPATCPTSRTRATGSTTRSAEAQRPGVPLVGPELVRADAGTGVRRVQDPAVAVVETGVHADVVDPAAVVEEDQVAAAHRAARDPLGEVGLRRGRPRDVREACVAEAEEGQPRAVEAARAGGAVRVGVALLVDGDADGAADPVGD